jgi:hypothetical protein
VRRASADGACECLALASSLATKAAVRFKISFSLGSTQTLYHMRQQ